MSDSGRWMGGCRHDFPRHTCPHCKELVLKDAEIQRLKKLIHCMWIHSGYRNNGYSEMTTEQKQIYDDVISEPKEPT